MTRATFALVLLLCVFRAAPVSAGETAQPNYLPADGVIPDEKTAILVGEAILTPIYGEKKILNERPFKATLKNGTWTVEGSIPKGMLGGAATIEIAKSNGCVLRIIHGL